MYFLRTGWRKRKSSVIGWSLGIILSLLILLILAFALVPSSAPIWTGFGQIDPSIPRSKTLWDWMELLIVPIILVVIAIWFNKNTSDRDRKIAVDNREEEALNNYFAHMSELLLDHNLYIANKNSDVRFIALAETLSVLRQVRDTIKWGFS